MANIIWNPPGTKTELPLEELPSVPWDIWVEGYACTGGSGGAWYAGTAKGKTFSEAVLALRDKNPKFAEYHRQTGTNHYHWGCECYPTEQEARKTYG